MDERQRQYLRNVLDVLLRQKKLLISFMLLGIVGGIGAYILFPKTYQATALLTYQHQRINPNQMSPDYQTGFIQILSTLGKEITSLTSLEDLIVRFDLYPELRQEKSMAEIVQTMRMSIQVTPEHQGNIFRVNYRGNDPEQVKLVTNAIAGKFIAENLRFREEWTTDNLHYIKNELQMAKQTLDEKESVMRDYKMKHYNEMAEQRATNMTRLNALQAQNRHLQTSIQDLERTKALIQEQITMRRDFLARAGAVEQGRGQFGGGGNEYADLATARRNLAAMQSRYTEQHPDIIRLKSWIVQLEKEAALVGGSGESDLQPGGILDQPVRELGLQIKDIDMNIGTMRLEMEKVKAQMDTYLGWIEAAPVREAEWTALTRDYNEFRKYYEQLLTRSLEAEAAETLEKQQKGSQFRIVDAAVLPDRPFRPNFIQFVLIAALMGIGLGGGLSFLLESLDTSFKDAGDLEAYLGIPVTCSIPLIYTEQEKKAIRLKANLWATTMVLVVLGIIGGVVTLWYKQIIIV
jgi:polysaccharide biosynthesis transport protein